MNKCKTTAYSISTMSASPYNKNGVLLYELYDTINESK